MLQLYVGRSDPLFAVDSLPHRGRRHLVLLRDVYGRSQFRLDFHFLTDNLVTNKKPGHVSIQACGYPSIYQFWSKEPTMKSLLDISKRFSPPTCDLRCGRLCDDHGSTTAAQLLIFHRLPRDVKKEHFEYYQDVFNFLSPNDILFYLWPMFEIYGAEKDSMVFENYTDALIRFQESIQKHLEKTNTNA